MFNKGPGIGIDIGSRKIKLAKVKRKGNKLQVLKYASMTTPAGIVEAGNIYDPEELGTAMAQIVKELRLQGKQVVSAVSGPQVYTRNLVMPRMSLKELKEAISFQATTFLPIPVEEAAIDIFPLRDFEDEEGKKTEVFFVAVRSIQVQNLQAACKVAGLKLVAVEIEPLAVHRVFAQNDNFETRAFLHIGAYRSYFSVFKEGILLFHRSLSFGSSAFYKARDFTLTAGIGPVEADKVEFVQNEQYDYLLRDVISEISRSFEYYNMQHSEDTLDQILICGAGARLTGLDEPLSANLGCEVVKADTLSRLILPNNLGESDEEELLYDFPIALGLAAREVI